MREIKFRAWDKDEQILHSDVGSGIYCDPDEILGFDRILGLACYEVMQFTGLKDKNDVEIYEGDIVEVASEEFMHEVEWIGYEESGYPIGWGLFPNSFTYEVIGNIYENPNLLEESK